LWGNNEVTPTTLKLWHPLARFDRLVLLNAEGCAGADHTNQLRVQH
jgi:hypothetical protein